MSSSFPDDTDRLVDIGRAVENMKTVEIVVHRILSGFISSDDQAAIIALSNSGLDGWLKKLASFSKRGNLSPRAQGALTEWISDANSAREARNAVIHTATAFSEDGEAIDLSISKVRYETRPSKLHGFKEVRTLVSDARSLIEKAGPLTKILTNEPSWHGQPLVLEAWTPPNPEDNVPS